MFTIMVILHILVALTLILVVLLQVGKGGSIGAAFGGGGGGSSQTLFGSRGPATFLSHLTTGAATVFMLTSLALAFLSSNARNQSSITDQVPAAPQAPAPSIPAAPQAPASGDSATTPPATSTTPQAETPAATPKPETPQQ